MLSHIIIIIIIIILILIFEVCGHSDHTLRSVSSGKINLKILSDLTGASVTKSGQTFFLQEQSFASLGSFLGFFSWFLKYFSVTSSVIAIICYRKSIRN